MYAPTTDPEVHMLAGYADSQVDALRASAADLTDDQARQRPARSELCLGGLLRHVTYVLRQHAEGGRSGEIDEAGYHAFMDSFAFDERHTLAEVLAELDHWRAACRERTLRSDPDEESLQPPAPWDGLPAMMGTRRYEMLHLVEELARHAGHADILREQLDGRLVPDLEARAAGREVWDPAAS
ncbi:mycothiol transferase [Arsenicicoccus sp. oral taxon 190]|uniref:mycothiol transferase n=1 Tax=Arsenicicoccus sp. oral taxon 190 TaxID=1658671 RepID=UPI00067A416A|nr:DUF664 domain-containing protein [Arsenicicoccus sp. oral taxon 190]AKT51816.1 hypothetical protein ADJ73_11985 [Arsenicicoccus sp. oral taxon 190]